MIQAETGISFSKSSITIINSDDGYKKLHENIRAFCGATGNSQIRTGLESTGIYHTNIISFLLSQNYQVMMTNPILTNMVRKASKVYSPKESE
jgi:transposase